MKKMMLYAKEDTVVPSNEEQVDTALLIIDEDGTVTGVTDKTKLNGTLALPAEVKKIGNNAFAGCTGLTNIGFSACTGLTQICEGAFRSCTGLTKVHLPASLTKIGVNAFRKCSNLHTLTVDPANKTYCSHDNVIYTKDMKTLVCAAGGML